MRQQKKRKEESGYIDVFTLLLWGIVGFLVLTVTLAIVTAKLNWQVLPANIAAGFSQIIAIVPWKVIGIIVVGIAVLAGVVSLPRLGARLYRNFKQTLTAQNSTRKNKSLNQNFWEKTFRTHDTLLSQWGKYELDVEELIRYPLMTDATDPHTKHLLETIHEADILRPQEADPNLDVSQTSYGKAVKELSSALNAAIANAKRKAWSNFTPKEQSKLNTALQMLKLAQDAGASVNERQAAYKRVLAEVEGLIYLPEKPVALLEAAVLKTIEAPSHSQPSLVLN